MIQTSYLSVASRSYRESVDGRSHSQLGTTWVARDLRGCSNYISTSSSPQPSLCATSATSIASSFPVCFILLQHLPLTPSSDANRLRSATINVASWYQKWPFPESKNRRLLIKGSRNKFLLLGIGVFTIPWTPGTRVLLFFSQSLLFFYFLSIIEVLFYITLLFSSIQSDIRSNPTFRTTY